MFSRRMFLSLIPFLFCLFLCMSPPVKASSEPYAWPLRGPVAVRFRAGYWDEGDSKTRTHCGIDICAVEGSTVYAAADGVVAFAGSTPAGGLTISIKHTGGIRTTYLPLQKIMVNKGQKVKKGEQIAILAVSGDKSLGETHLHMGAILAGEYIDPESLLSGLFKVDLTQLVRLGNIPISGTLFNQYTGGFQEEFKVMSDNDKSWWERFVDMILSLPEAAMDFVKWATEQCESLGRWLIYLCKTGEEFLVRQFLWILKGLFMSVSDIRRLIMQYMGDNTRLAMGYLPGNCFLPGFTLAMNGGFRVDRHIFDPSGDQSEDGSRVRIVLNKKKAGSAAVYGEDGSMVKNLGSYVNGDSCLIWDGSDESGRIVPEGSFTIVVLTESGMCKEKVEVKYHLAGGS